MADNDERPKIDSAEALEAWLADKPAEWAQVIAVRAALRVFPLVFGIHDIPNGRLNISRKQKLILMIFRAVFISRASGVYPNFEIGNAPHFAVKSVNRSSGLEFTSFDIRNAVQSCVVATIASGVGGNANSFSARAAYEAARAAAAIGAAGTVWQAVSEDCSQLLERGPRNDLVHQSLWLSDVRGDPSYNANFPLWVREPFDRFAARDEVKNGPWGLIVDWYRAILPNSRNAKPRSLFGEKADIAITTQPDEFWTVTDERSAEDVLRDIGRIRDGNPPVFKAASSSAESDTVSGPAGDDDRASADSDVLRTDAVPTHSDEPTCDDQLGRRPFARALVERIEEVRKTSGDDGFAVHLHAPWGAGKTSILLMMQEMLRKPAEGGTPWAVVQFNAWEHERRKPPWWPLIQALKVGCVDCLNNYGPWWVADEVKRTWRQWIFLAEGPPYVIGLFVLALLVSAALWGGSEWLKIGAGSFTVLMAVISAGILLSRRLYFGSADGSKLYFDLSRDPMKKISELFREIIDTTDRPVCVFIDDLDRCNADYVVDLLEGIQTSFRHRNVTYVIAADRAWLRTSFEQRYSDFSDHVGTSGQPLGYLFLEKVFQVSTPVPGMGGMKKRYWNGLLKAGAGTEDKPPGAVAEVGAIKTATARDDAFDREVRDRRDEIRREFGTDLTEEDVVERLETTISETERAAIVLELSASRAEAGEVEHLLASFVDTLPDNPRVMKRMINTYAMRRAIGHLEGNPVGREVLARWTILEQRFPALADLLIEHPDWADMLVKEGVKVIDMPQALQPLAGDADVMKVLGEPGSSHPLRGEDIATITRGSAT